MFSQRTSRRFPEEHRDPKPGPGAYNVPSSLDDKAPSMEGSQRWQDGSPDLPGPGEYDVSPDIKNPEPLAPVPVQRRALPEKENRAPSAGSLRKSRSMAGGPRSPRDGLCDPEKPKREDARLTSQLETLREELKQKTRENKELQNFLSAKDHKVEELQRRAENLVSEKREAQRKVLEVEAERDAKRRQFHEKEQELQSLQRKSEHNRATAEERKRALERKDNEQKAHAADVQRLKTQVDLLQDKVNAAERDRKAADALVERAERDSRQHEKRFQEQEAGFKEHVAVIEESLRREEARRRALEETNARSGAQLEQGGQDLAAERQRTQDFQLRIARLEEDARQDARHQLAKQNEQRESQSRLESELAASKGKLSHAEDIRKQLEETRKQLDERVARAEVARDAHAKEIQTLTQHNADLHRKVAELEGELQQFGETVCNEMRSKVTTAEEKVEGTKRELRDERDRSEDLERRLARAEEELAKAQHRAQEAEAIEDPKLFEQRALRAEEEVSLKDDKLRRLQEWVDEQNLRELTAETERIKELERVRQDVTKQVSAARDEVVNENKALQQRIKELERVRQDVTKQVSAARDEVVNENKALQQRIKDLETGPDGAETLKLKLAEKEQELDEKARALADADAGQADLDMQLKQMKCDLREKEEQVQTSQKNLEEVGRRAEEEKRTLDNRINHLEADASVVADEAAEEREQLETKLKAVKIEYETAMNTRADEEAASRAAERQAAAQQLHALEETLSQVRSTGAVCKWRLFSEASAVRQLVQASEADWRQVFRAVRMWRARASGHERDADQLARQGEELERLDIENESLGRQSRQMLLSLQQAQAELQWSLAEMKHLQEKEAEYEGQIMSASERNAALAGHNNSKQKIKHVVSLKEQIDYHRLQNKKAHQRIKQLEALLRNANFYESLVTGAGVNGGELSDLACTPAPSRPATPSKQRNMLQLPVTPGRPAPRTPMRGTDGDRERDLEKGADDAARRARQEQVRYARLQEKEAEYEGQIMSACERNAALAGHNNSKQKIKHVVSLKEQIDYHRLQNKKAHQRIKQLEALLRNANFYESLVTGAGVNGGELSDLACTPAPSRPATPSKQRNMLQLPVTPGRPAPRTPMRGTDRDRERDFEKGADDAARRARQEQVRHAKAHSRASERATAEFQHLAAMCEQVLSMAAIAPTWQQPIAVSCTALPSGTQTPACGSEAATGAADSSQLFQRLRELASKMSTSTVQATQMATASATLSQSVTGERTPVEAPQKTEAQAEDGDAEEVMPTDSDENLE
eukprot:CAMPEP_0172778294 /NCGR_PEP_ID=MMETSP1074-20121228/201833_1 /TAXON_ID=2916 /ORGANISM="Ceratium fusus, Strain PA161109" /LENGTH=1285 /DNA_ID=CAMNT_0013615225 /DNA_START=77 /DNA_END=3935 /DNA_ORIENTATION=-